MSHVVVIGAGLAGLSAACHLVATATGSRCSSARTSPAVAPGG